MILDIILQFNNIDHMLMEIMPITNKTMIMVAALIRLYKVNFKNLQKSWLNSWSISEELREKSLKK